MARVTGAPSFIVEPKSWDVDALDYGALDLSADTLNVSMAGAATQATLASVLAELQLKADLTETQPVSAASLPLPTGAATSLGQNTGNLSLSSIDSKITAVNTNSIVGSVTANAGANLNTSALSLEATQADVRTAVQLIDNAVSGAGFNITQFGGANAATGSGTATGALRVELPTNGTGVIATVGTLTSITNALPTGANVIGRTGIDQTTPGTTNKVTLGADSVAVTNANLDVALSTRLKPADTLAGVTTVAAVTSITNPVAVTGPVTDAQLRAAAVPVSLAVAPTTAVTNANLDSPLSGILTELQAKTEPADQQHVIVDSAPANATGANVVAVDGDPAYTLGASAQAITETTDGRLRVVTSALVSDAPESYLPGTIRTLSLNSEGRLRVTMVPAQIPTYDALVLDFTSASDQSLWNMDMGPWSSL